MAATSANSSGSRANSSGGLATISVEMAEVRMCTRLTESLVAYGLGACIAICLYDSFKRVAGMAHIVMPERARFLNGSASQIAAASPGKFADSAVPMLLEQFCRVGSEVGDLRAAIAGGAQIFGSSGRTSSLEIGARNAAAVREALKAHGISICAEDVGGNCGRTVLFRVCDGAVIVKPIGGQARALTVLSKALGGAS